MSSSSPPLRQWSVQRVQWWLKQQRLDEFCDTFLSNGIDGPSLMQITKADLKDELDIVKISDRKRVWSAIEELLDQHNESQPSNSLPSLPSSTVSSNSNYSSTDSIRSKQPTSPPFLNETEKLYKLVGSNQSTPSSTDPKIEPTHDVVIDQMFRESQALIHLMKELEDVKIGEIKYSPVTSDPNDYPYVRGRVPTYNPTKFTPTNTSTPSPALDKALGSYDNRTRILTGKVDYSQLLQEQKADQARLDVMKGKHEEVMRLAGFR